MTTSEDSKQARMSYVESKALYEAIKALLEERKAKPTSSTFALLTMTVKNTIAMGMSRENAIAMITDTVNIIFDDIG